MTGHLAASLLVLQQNKNKAEELAHYLTNPAKMAWGSRSGHYKTHTLILLSWILSLTLTLLSWIPPLILHLCPESYCSLLHFCPESYHSLSHFCPESYHSLLHFCPESYHSLLHLSGILPLTLTFQSWILSLSLAHAAAAAATVAHHWPLPHRLEEALDAAQTKLPTHDGQRAQLLVGGGVGRGQGGHVDGVANGLVAGGVDHVA